MKHIHLGNIDANLDTADWLKNTDDLASSGVDVQAFLKANPDLPIARRTRSITKGFGDPGSTQTRIAHGEFGPGSGVRSKYTDTQQRAVEGYCANVGHGKVSSYEINKYMRTGETVTMFSRAATPESIAYAAQQVQDAIDANKTPDYITVYRGGKFGDVNVGDTITDKGFISTTPNADIASRFPQGGMDGAGHMNRSSDFPMLAIDVPSGTNAIVPPEGRYSKGQELVLGPGTVTVTGLSTYNGRTLIQGSYARL